MKIGIIGLPNVGKSTLFNALVGGGAEAANYPFCTIEPNVGVVPVPDARLDKLTEMYSPVKTTPATVEFVDIAGIVKGASAGEGLGNKFLSHIREVDALVHTVRCFEDENITHVSASVDPVADSETINIELILADLEVLERRIDKTAKALKGGDKKFEKEYDLLKRLEKHLSDGKPARSFDCTEDERAVIETVSLLSLKPVIYAANMSEADFTGGIENNAGYRALCETAEREHAGIIPVCAKLEQDLNAFDDPEERKMFLAEIGLEESGLNRLIRECYALLGYISYFTAGQPEVRAWTITKGTKAPDAAGKIHTDFKRGFIRAEIVSYEDLIACGSIAAAREKGLYRSEGKEYVVRDGDVILFRFNV